MMPPKSEIALEQYLEIVHDPASRKEQDHHNHDNKSANDDLDRILVLTASSSSSDSAPKRRISFSKDIQVREYKVTIGDDRQCDYPMTLTWDHSKSQSMDLEELERKHRRQRPRRLSSKERCDLLRSVGHSISELARIHRKRKTRLTMEYAYGYTDTSEAAQFFEDQKFQYII
jgi:hypothetical protein